MLIGGPYWSRGENMALYYYSVRCHYHMHMGDGMSICICNRTYSPKSAYYNITPLPVEQVPKWKTAKNLLHSAICKTWGCMISIYLHIYQYIDASDPAMIINLFSIK